MIRRLQLKIKTVWYKRVKRLHDRIAVFIYDFDGVMTDNRVLLRQDGLETVQVTRADGLGVDMIRRLGIKQMIVSTETNPVVTQRARKLRIDAVAGCSDKKDYIDSYCAREGIGFENVLYVGNDLNDLEAMQHAGFSLAPKDAHPLIRKTADFVTEAKGGEGVIKELADWLMSEYKWQWQNTRNGS